MRNRNARVLFDQKNHSLALFCQVDQIVEKSGNGKGVLCIVH